MTFVNNNESSTTSGNASVNIAKGENFVDKHFVIGTQSTALTFTLGNAADPGTLAYEFYGPDGTGGIASEVVGGFSYWEGLITDSNGRIGVVGGFGGILDYTGGRNDVIRLSPDQACRPIGCAPRL
jgi:hypothetical protein